MQTSNGDSELEFASSRILCQLKKQAKPLRSISTDLHQLCKCVVGVFVRYLFSRHLNGQGTRNFRVRAQRPHDISGKYGAV